MVYLLKLKFCPPSLFDVVLFCVPNIHPNINFSFLVCSKLLEDMTSENTRLAEILQVKEETERKQGGT